MDILNRVKIQLQQVFDPDVIADQLALVITNLIVLSIVLVLFYFAWRLIDFCCGILFPRTDFDETSISFVRTSLKFTTISMGVIVALNAIGISYTSLFASIGVMGLTIGFAAKNTLSNAISGLFIYWDRPFVITDIIETGGLEGKVEDITLRSTKVVSPDGKMLTIPNSSLVNSPVASLTNFPNLRIESEFQIDSGEDLADVRSIVETIVESDGGFLTNPSPTVELQEVTANSMKIRVLAWIRDERAYRKKTTEFRERLKELFEEQDIKLV